MKSLILTLVLWAQVFTLQAADVGQRDISGRRMIMNCLTVDRSSFPDERVFLYTPAPAPGNVPLICISCIDGLVKVEIRQLDQSVLEAMLPPSDEPIFTLISGIPGSSLKIVKKQPIDGVTHSLSTMMDTSAPLTTLEHTTLNLYQLFLLKGSLAIKPELPDTDSGVSQITIAALDPAPDFPKGMPGARFLTPGGVMVSGCIDFEQVDFLKGNFYLEPAVGEPASPPCFAAIGDVLALVIKGTQPPAAE